MHGARGGAPSGPANGRWRHGNRTRASDALRLVMAELVKEARETAKALGNHRQNVVASGEAKPSFLRHEDVVINELNLISHTSQFNKF